MTRLRDRARQVWATLRTIRARLTLGYVGFLALVLVGFSAFVYLNLSSGLRAEVDHSLATAASTLIAEVEIEDGRPKLDDGLEHLSAGMAVALYDAGGEHLIANDARQPLPTLVEPLARAAGGQQASSTIRLADGTDWRVLSLPVVENGRSVAVLQVARSMRDIQLATSQLVVLLAVAIPVTLLLAVAGGLFLAGRALNPVDRITRAVDRMGAEDLSRRLNLPASPDELGRLAATFDRLLDRIDRAFQRQRQFAADASHELRTPLAILKSQVDVAFERPRSATEYRTVLASVREDAVRMSRLLGELLTLARADAGHERRVMEPIALDDLIEDVVGAMLPLAASRGVTLKTEAAGPVVVDGDQTRLTQLVVNLINNSLTYTPSGGTVVAAVKRDGARAALQIADTGVGIAVEHLPHLFERFYRVDMARSRDEGGSGLGLAISQWIVRAHGGDIAVQSRLGEGTTFTVSLPVRTGRPFKPGEKSCQPRQAATID